MKIQARRSQGKSHQSHDGHELAQHARGGKVLINKVKHRGKSEFGKHLAVGMNLRSWTGNELHDNVI